MAISIGSKGKGKTAKKAVKVPTKTTMNFARRESSFNWKKMLPIILILVLAVGLFVKFGFLDQMSKKVEAYSRLSEKQTMLAACNTKLAGYDELHSQYGRYSYGWMTDTEVNTVDRMDVLGLIEKYIMPSAGIQDFAVSSNVLTLNLTGISLQQASTMVKALEQDDLVVSASVYNASAPEGEEASIFMSIVLISENELASAAGEAVAEEAA